MNTDFTPHPPHVDYEATLHVRGTKAWFHSLRDLLMTTDPEDPDQIHVKDFILREVDEIINWINNNEPYYQNSKL